MSSILHRLLHGTVLLIVLLCASDAHARIWRDINGNEIEGEFVRKEGNQVTLLVNGEERTYPISTFSSLDKTYISRQKNPGTTEPSQPAPMPQPMPAEPPTTPPTTPENTTPPATTQPAVPQSEFRIWRTSTNLRIRARYVSFDEETNSVRLQLDNGQLQYFPFDNFSFADKQEVRDQLAAAARANQPQTPIASNTPEPSITPETPETSGVTEPQETTRPRRPRNTPAGETWARFVHRRKATPVAVASVPPTQSAPPTVSSPATPTPSTTPGTPAPAPAVSPMPTSGQPLMTQVNYGDSSGDSNPMMLVAIVMVIVAVGAFVYSRSRG